jgi:hypothetical protein
VSSGCKARRKKKAAPDLDAQERDLHSQIGRRAGQGGVAAPPVDSAYRCLFSFRWKSRAPSLPYNKAGRMHEPFRLVPQP